MKKIFVAMLVGLMAVSITACSNGNNAQVNSDNTQPSASTNVSTSSESSVEESSEESSEESTLAVITKTDSSQDDYLTDTKLYKSFYEKVQGDNFHMAVEGEISMSGVSMSISMEVQKQGDSTYTVMNMFGINVKGITKDGYTYTLNDKTKKYSKEESEEGEESGSTYGIDFDMTGSMEDLEFIENGLSSEENTTDYEKYSTEDSKMTVYFNGDEIKYIEVESTETSTQSSGETEPVRIDISLTSEIDESLFEIPSDYEEVDYSELYDLSSMFSVEE